ncbi:MAG TPA: protease modulator HflC [Gemmataceae bacterium]|nr:protease modulator HflC [Gemmataceae bacterium]
MRIVLSLIVLVVLAVLARLCIFTVDRSEYVYVTLAGKHVATYDGATEAGPYLRWPAPIQSIERLDRRLQQFDLPGTEQLTRDAGGQTIDRTLMVQGYVCWRIADAGSVDRFIRTVGTPDRAQAILSQQISSQLSAEIGKMRMEEFVSDSPGQVDAGMAQLRERLLAQFRHQPNEESPDDYGIEVVDIRLRRYNYPEEVRPDINARIVSERNKKKAEYESEATVKVGKINADADRTVKQIDAEAEADAKRIMSRADAEADRIRNEAFSKDPQFYVFLKKLEEYGNILGNNRTVLLLSSHRELFDLLFTPPHVKAPSEKTVQPEANSKAHAATVRKGHD